MSKVTVVLPVYNGGSLLPYAIDSILQQTYTNIDFLIINDGSNDGTLNYLNSLEDPRIKTIHQNNKGLTNSLNIGLELCDTEYFARMDADDVSLPNRLHAQIRYLDENPGVVLVGTQINFICNYEVINASPMPIDHWQLRFQLMKGRPVICHPSVMFRTHVARMLGGYKNMKYGQDIDFFLRMSEVGTINNLNQVLHYYRIGSDSIVSNNHKRLSINIEYAISCAHCRIKGMQEPEFDTFIKQRRKKFFKNIFRDSFFSFSTIAYRKAIYAKSKSMYANYAFFLFISAIFRPIRAFEFLLKR